MSAFDLSDLGGDRLTIGLRGHHAGLGQLDFRSSLAECRPGLLATIEQVGGVDLGEQRPLS